MGRFHFLVAAGMSLVLSGVVLSGSGLLASEAQAAGPAAAPQGTVMQAQRSAATAAARQALPGYLSQIPEQRLKDYGFETSQQLAQARIDVVWPVFMPARTKGSLTRAAIERQMAGTPALWLAPVWVDGRPVALVTVEIAPSGKAEAVGFGSAFRASRIAAGLKAAGLPGIRSASESVAGNTGISGITGSDGAQLRLVAFYEPNREFALLPGARPTAAWRWFSLEGTSEASAIELTDEALRLALEEIRQTEPKAPVGAAPPGR